MTEKKHKLKNIKEKFNNFLDRTNFDLIYKWATFIIIPAYIITAEFGNEIFFFYLFLAILKIVKDGYKKCGLEVVFFIAIIGLMISSLDEGHSRILKNCLRVARIISLPILMYQYKPIKDLKTYLILLFSGLAIYGVIRINLFPIVQGYSDREFCFSNFFMNSSVIAFSGYIFFLTLFLKRKDNVKKIISAFFALLFLYLIAKQGVRGSYIAFAILTPAIVIYELKTKIIRFIPLIIIIAFAALTITEVTAPKFVETTKERVTSIFNKNQGSNRGRLFMWKRGLETFSENPINGVGYKRFNKDHIDLKNDEFEWAFWHAHNEIITMLAETGLVGTLAWLLFKMKLLWLLFKRKKCLISSFILYLFIAFEIHNIFEVYLFERVAYIYVYLLIGLCWIKEEHNNEQQ
jgi:O-antigen ligase